VRVRNSNPVTVILNSLAEGFSEEEIPRSYPSLKPVHIQAALSYAAELEQSVLPSNPAPGS
jgi:uncharacterized protein (DUF433 family)